MCVAIYYETFQVKEFHEFPLYDAYAFAADVGKCWICRDSEEIEKF